MSNNIRTRDRAPQNFVDGLKVKGILLEDYFPSNTFTLTDYTELRDYTGKSTSVYITDPGISGFFYYDPTDTTSADNGGTVIVSGSKRWKRLFDGAIYANWFGAKGDWDDSTGTNNSLFINTALLYGNVIIDSGDYMLSSEIEIPSGRNLHINKNATIIRNFNSSSTYSGTIKNKNHLTGDNHISVTGEGFIRSANSSIIGKHFVFFNVSNLHLKGFNVRNTYSDWVSKFVKCSNVVIDGLNIDTLGTQIYTDGLHFKGISKLQITNCNIKTGDDCLSFTCETAEDDNANITDVIVSDCNLEVYGSSSIKILIDTGRTCLIERLQFNNISSRVQARNGAGGLGFYIWDFDNTKSIRDVTISNMDINANGSAENFGRIYGCSNIKLNNLSAYKAAKGLLIENTNYLYINKIRIYSSNGLSFVPNLISSSLHLRSVDYFSINNADISGSTLHGIQLGSPSFPARYGSVCGGSFTSNTNTGVRLANATECVIDGVVCKENVNGIIEDSGSNINKIINCSSVTNTTNQIVINGANTKVFNNYGYVSYNYGTATIGNGNTVVTVTHGLATTPSSNTIRITPKNNLGTSNKFWISSVTSVSFNINVDISPGAATAIFGWEARTVEAV